MERRDAEMIAGPWASRIVERYASQARPELSAAARLVLLDHLTRRLAPAMAITPAGDWPAVANAALDTWEDEA